MGVQGAHVTLLGRNSLLSGMKHTISLVETQYFATADTFITISQSNSSNLQVTESYHRARFLRNLDTMALSLLVSTWRPDFIPIAVGILLVSLLWRYLAKNKEIDVPLLTDDGNDFHKIMDEGYKLVSYYAIL